MKKWLVLMAFMLPMTLQAGEVSRAQFTSAVDQREPLDQLITLDAPTPTITFFTELNDLQGQSISHQWFYNDKVMFEKSFEVKGPRWRVWSTKNLPRGWTGDWTVKVVDEQGSVLRSESFLYQ